MRKKIIPIVVVIIIAIAGAVATIITIASPTPEPVSMEEAKRLEPTVTEGVEDGDGYDYEYIEPTVVQGEEMTPDDIMTKYIPLAEKAAREYVSQNTEESGDERTKRLLTVFHSDSDVFYSEPPNVDKSNSPNTYSKPTILYNEWEVAGNNILVTVSMRVDTYKTVTKDRVSRIYQVYDVVLTEQGGVYRAMSIKFSNKPVVIGQ